MKIPFHLHFCFFIFILCTKLSYCSIKNNTISFCPEIEKHSLLSFKQSLGSCPPTSISSWDGELNCCKWEGVLCNNSTGHVSHLQLHDDPFMHCDNYDVGGKLNESLSNLKYLIYLDLSGNNFSGETIPSFIGSFSYLEYLDLSHTRFQGKIPPHIGNLKRLTHLDLSRNYYFADETIPSFIGSFSHLEYLNLSYARFQGKIPPHIENLKHLTYLDLSGNSFTGETIPSFIGSFSRLEYLNLSDTEFQGKIPPHIGNLSNLRALDLSMNFLESESLEWLNGLSKLEYLNMERANLSRANNWAEVINSLPSLLEFHLRECYIEHFQLHVNNLSTSLAIINLSNNNPSKGSVYKTIPSISDDRYNPSSNDDSYKSFPIPQWFFQLKSLVSLDLSESYFYGEIPVLSNATKLQFLDLSSNGLSSTIPDWVYSCKDLRFLDLSYNYIQGQISDLGIGNLTSLEKLHLGQNELSGKLPREITNLCRLQELDLSNNELEGQVEDSFGAISDCFLGSLKVLDLSHNRLAGHLTEKFGEFKVLESLWLNDNKLTGNLPVSLGKLSKLDGFYIGNNRLEGIVNEAHFANLSNLTRFSASGTHLTLSVGPNWILPENIIELRLGFWRLGDGPHVPSWLHRERQMLLLDISHAGISGLIPSWFSHIPFLDVSNNNLHGTIPYINSLVTDMSNNNFSGPLPQTGGGWSLDLSHNAFYGGLSNLLCASTYQSNQLDTLILEGNLLSGELPDCWEKWPNLQYLNVGNNTMSGRLPDSFGSLRNLRSLNLRGNKFTGQIPFSMRSCTGLLKMDLGHNNLDGNVPTWIGTNLEMLKILILRSNKFIGEIPWELCHLQSLQILDLSSNQISGVTPKCLHNLTAMATKRTLSHVANQEIYEYYLLEGPPFTVRATVATKGLELEYTTIIPLVTNIDLSSNNLSGEIPTELTRLVILGSLNLSRNQLSGSIPESIGEMKQLESVDLSRNSLSGQIPNGFSNLSYLSFLDLSFNNLRGRIPKSTQLQTMDASRYMGNDLCGPPLARHCIGDEGGGPPGHDGGGTEEGKKKKGEVEWIYVLVSLGYAVGFSGVCSVLVLKKSWRDAYFGLAEKVWDKLYVYFYVWIKRS